jgi:hypothetical protein
MEVTCVVGANGIVKGDLGTLGGICDTLIPDKDSEDECALIFNIWYCSFLLFSSVL